MTMKRAAFKHDNQWLSYLDSGGDGPLIVTLHAMWMEARTFEGFAGVMPEWRVVSLDQRGHGLSDHAPDYSRAYILASDRGSIFVVDLGVNAVSAIPLTGNPVPLDASLTPDGTLIYVGANDGSVHVVSTVSGGDLQQITFSTANNSNKTSLCSNVPQTCNPDLVAVQP